MSSFKLPRRALLRGIGGAALALPILDVMLGRDGTVFADGSPLPKRYVVVFGGHSLGMGYNDPTLPLFARDEPRDMFVPDIVGPGYDLKTALTPLGDYGVTDLVSVVSGLRIPYATSSSEPTPAAGVPNVFHGPVLHPLLSGMRSGTPAKSSDEHVAAAIAGDTIFRSVHYRAQPETYWIDNADVGFNISFTESEYNAPVKSPAIAYQAMMDKIALTDPGEQAARELLMRERISVLDLVHETSPKLMKRLGAADRERLERHFDEIRALEVRLAAPEVSCEALPIPEDPPIGGAVVSAEGGENVYTSEWDQKGWSDESTRAALFCDLIAMAFRCDLTRVVTLGLTNESSNMSVYHLTGARVDVHGCSHFAGGSTDSGSTDLMSRHMQAYHIRHYAYLVDKLRDMIDDCAVVYTCEGGVGASMEAPGPDEQPKAHSTENMACLIAGRAGGLSPGQHVVAPPGQNHPANVLLSAMSAVGVPGDTLGEVTGVIPGLFG